MLDRAVQSVYIMLKNRRVLTRQLIKRIFNMNNITKTLALINFSVLALSASTTTFPEATSSAAAQIMCDVGIAKIETQLEMEAEFQRITKQFEIEKKQVQEKVAITLHPVCKGIKYGATAAGIAVGAYFAPAFLICGAIKCVPALYSCIFSAPTSYVGYPLWWAGQYNAIGAVISQGFYPAIFAGASIGGGCAKSVFELFIDTALYAKHKLTELDTEYGMSQSISDTHFSLHDDTLCDPLESKQTGILSGLGAFTASWTTRLWG